VGLWNCAPHDNVWEITSAHYIISVSLMIKFLLSQLGKVIFPVTNALIKVLLIFIGIKGLLLSNCYLHI